ncbi:MAG TPA: 4-hydroxy-tetrahydrodipicolinate synthase [Steroidobacteraceae bacterium]
MFSGSLVAIATPMRPDGALDAEAWLRLLDFHLQHGTSAVVVGGTTGESVTLTDAELHELVDAALKFLRGRIPVIAGAGTSSTATTVERVRWLAQLRIDGLLVVTPAYNRPTQEGLYRHFTAVADAASVPVIVYNVPSRTAVDLLPGTVARLSQLRRLTAVKEAVPSMERIRALVRDCREGFVVLSGDDASAREAVAAGARGVISVTANVAPRAMADMMAAALRGDAGGAAAIDARLAALHRDLFVETSPIPVKWALAQMRLAGPTLRLPLTELTAAYHATLRAALAEAAVL